MSQCLICLQPLDKAVDLSNCCPIKVHGNCLYRWNLINKSCIICKKPQDLSKHMCLNDLKQFLIDSNLSGLINGYFFNSHDIPMITKDHGSTKLIIVRYPVNNTYQVSCLENQAFQDMMSDPQCLRQLLMKERVKYIFTDNYIDDYDKVCLDIGGIAMIGIMPRQIQW